MECLKKKERGRERQRYTPTQAPVCAGKAAQYNIEQRAARLAWCVCVCVYAKERERVRVCPRHAEMSKLSLSSCRETQTKAESQPLLLLITSHWRALCEEGRQWSRSNSHTHLSTPHRVPPASALMQTTKPALHSRKTQPHFGIKAIDQSEIKLHHYSLTLVSFQTGVTFFLLWNGEFLKNVPNVLFKYNKTEWGLELSSF